MLMVCPQYECQFCQYHVKAQYQKMSSKRAELQSSFSGKAPRRVKGKGSGLRERLCQDGFYYGGVSSPACAASLWVPGPRSLSARSVPAVTGFCVPDLRPNPKWPPRRLWTRCSSEAQLSCSVRPRGSVRMVFIFSFSCFFFRGLYRTRPTRSIWAGSFVKHADLMSWTSTLFPGVWATMTALNRSNENWNVQNINMRNGARGINAERFLLRKKKT